MSEENQKINNQNQQNENLEKLKALLKEMFQFNTNLDFGVYKIYNLKQKQLTEFIGGYILFNKTDNKYIALEDGMVFKGENNKEYFYKIKEYEENGLQYGILEDIDGNEVKQDLKDLKRTDKEDDINYSIYYFTGNIENIVSKSFKDIEKQTENEKLEKIKSKVENYIRKKDEEKFKEIKTIGDLKGFINNENIVEEIDNEFDKQKLQSLLKQENKDKSKEQLQNEVYNHIYNFFSLYYAGGDFAYNKTSGETYNISLDTTLKSKLKDKIKQLENYEKGTEDYEKVNKEIEKLLEHNTNELPEDNTGYDGSDVFFTWKFRDCYYIKTSNTYRHLKTKQEEFFYNDEKKTFSFYIDLVDSDDEEKNDNKSSNTSTYTLKDINIKEGNNNYNINLYFAKNIENKSTTKKEILDKILEKFQEKGISMSSNQIEGMSNFTDDYKKKNTQQKYIEVYNKSKNKGEKANTFLDIKDNELLYKLAYRLEQALYSFVSGNENDVFIHKNLKDFLTKEKNFYINTKIIKDVTEYDEENALIAKSFNNITSTIIDFLSNIENFQKILFEMKKNIIQDEYCITLDKIDENIKDEIYDEILNNDEQINEWKNLGFIENENIDKDYLKEHQKLVLDTKFFDEDFKYKIISQKDNIDNELNGLLINSENYQGLNRILDKYRGKVKCIYIDPPYNTDNGDFLYKDSFRHSSWLSMMENRLSLAYELLKDDGVIFISIDDNEQDNLKKLMDKIFGSRNFIEQFHIQVRYANKSLNEKDDFQKLIEYTYLYGKNKSKFSPNRPTIEYDLSKFNLNIKELNKPDKTEWINGRKVDIFFPESFSIEKVSEQDSNNIDYFKETWVSGSIYSGTGHGKVYQQVVEGRNKQDGYGVLYKVYGLGDDGLGFRYFTGPKKKSATKGKMYNKVPLDKREDVLNGEAKKTIPIVNFFDYSADFGNIRHEGGVPFNSGKKPVKMLKEYFKISTDKNDIVLDFFSGSGSTQQAVVELNNEELGSSRKHIGIEMGDYFYDKTLKRLKNISNKNSQFFRYQKLEQYEDKLNNMVNTNQENQKDIENTNFIKEYNTYFNSLDLSKPFDNEIILDSSGRYTQTIDLFNTYLYNFKTINYINKINKNGKDYKIAVVNNSELLIFRNITENETDLKNDFENIKEILQKEVPNDYLSNNIKIHINYDFLKGVENIKIGTENVKINFTNVTNSDFIK